MKQSFDYNERTLTSGKYTYHLQFVASLVNDDLVSNICAGLALITDPTHLADNFFNGSLSVIEDKQKINLAILSGNIVIDVESVYYELDVRKYPSRSINEPETEKSVRGAKDGFIEAILTNVGLIRRRIRNPNLTFKKMQVGSLAPIDICLCYIEGLCDPNLKEQVEQKISQISTRDLVMSDRALEELLVQQVYNPFPLIRYSERPDIVSSHIVKGNIAIITDTSSSVMMLPTTLVEILEHVEEHRQVPIIGTMIRIVRLLAVFLSVYLVPLWILSTIYGNKGIFLLASIQDMDFNLFMMQIFVVEIAIELLELPPFISPTGLSSAMGMIAAVLLGEMAIDLGLFIPEILLYCAISNVGSFATPNYELSLGNKYIKLAMILSIWLFKNYGFIIFNFAFLLFLMNIQLFGVSYIYPFCPFNAKDVLFFFIRRPKPHQQ